jgi:5-methyltetrahydropteroyltriglutamate--homocysteine methyltransferase
MHADHIGSLLRPLELLEARAARGEGRIDDEQLRAVEDEAILEALALQRDAGLGIFSDGEYRRSWFAGALPGAVEGLLPDPEPMALVWEGAGSALATQAVADVGLGARMVGERVRQVRRLAGEESTFLREHAPGPFKICLTGVMQYVREWYRPGATDAYPTHADLVRDLVDIVRGEVAALVEEGASYVQLDSLLYVLPFPPELLADPTLSLDRMLGEMIEADNACLEPARRAGVTTGLHMCRGNNRSAWIPTGETYDAVAEQAFGSLRADRLLLEYDTERAGGFAPLRFVTDDTTVVLGLISSKVPELEPRDTLLRRIEEASEHVPVERLALSPQCGFASTAPGNLLTWDDQRRKLELTVTTAREVWGSGA